MAAIGDVDLVAVVGRRVVASGDHDPGGSLGDANKVGDDRCRHGVGEYPRSMASVGQHPSGHVRKVFTAMPSIPTDHHRRRLGQPLSNRHGSELDLFDIHAQRSVAERATKTCRSEREPVDHQAPRIAATAVRRPSSNISSTVSWRSSELRWSPVTK